MSGSQPVRSGKDKDWCNVDAFLFTPPFVLGATLCASVRGSCRIFTAWPEFDLSLFFVQVESSSDVSKTSTSVNDGGRAK